MKGFNVRKFLVTFAFLYMLMLFVTLASGCSAAFLGAISALIPALEAAISAAVAFVTALNGKTISASVTSAIQAWGTKVQGLIANLQSIITAAQGQSSAGVIAEIQAAMQAILSAITSILPEFNVTDSATVSKFTELLGLGVAAVQAILGFIPLVQAKLATPGITNEQLAAEDQVAKVHINNAHKVLQSTYKVIRDEQTASVDVNAALTTMPASLP
jgi:hypothetical protein